MTVLPKHIDEHPCHFKYGRSPLGVGEGRFLEVDPGAPQLHSKVLSYSFSVSPSLHGTSKRGPGKVVASSWEQIWG